MRNAEQITRNAARAVRASLQSVPAFARLNALLSDDMLLSMMRSAVDAALAEEAEAMPANVVAFPGARAPAADSGMSSLDNDIATMFPALNTDQASTLARAVRDVVSEAISAA